MPRLADGLVILRPFELRDAPLIATATTVPLIPLITTVPSGGTEADVRAYIDRQQQRLPTGMGYSFAIADADTDEAMGQIVALQVQGMDCGACERRLRTVLGRLDGVGQVEADHVTGRVRVRFDPSRVGAEALASAATKQIEQAGFTVTGHQPEGEATR